MLHVTRLTDRPNKALKIQSLERFVKDDPELLKLVKEHRKAADKAVAPVADRRNRTIAHRDQSLATGNSRKALGTVNLKVCKQVLDHVHAVLDSISLRYMKSSIANQIFYRPRSGGLVAYLKGLVDSVQYVASIIDPNYADGFNPARAREFLERLGRSEPSELQIQVFQLMDIARRCTESPEGE